MTTLSFQRFEAGIALFGTEVKSVRAGHVGLVDSYAAFENGELFLYNLSISTPTATGAILSMRSGGGGNCCCIPRNCAS